MASKTEQRRALLGQLIRYGINGVIVTVCGQAAYVGADTYTRASPQLCNFVGFLVSVAIGYVLHSRYTFKGQGERGWPAFARFFVAALPSFAVNAFWTWLIITALKLPHIVVQIPIFCVTPVMIFAINRWWVFK